MRSVAELEPRPAAHEEDENEEVGRPEGPREEAHVDPYAWESPPAPAGRGEWPRGAAHGPDEDLESRRAARGDLAEESMGLGESTRSADEEPGDPAGVPGPSGSVADPDTATPAEGGASPTYGRRPGKGRLTR